MIWIAEVLAHSMRERSEQRRRARALRELELLDQAALNDLGVSRAALVSMSHGQEAGRCSAY